MRGAGPKLVAGTVALVALLCAVSPADDRPPPPYRLVWSDEFDADGKPDSKKWAFEKGFVRNRELQWYRPENALCKNGTLVIEGRRERMANPDYEKNSKHWKRARKFAEYTSASLITRGLHCWKYGRFEIRARIKTRKGLWPAIWFLGTEGEWPSCGEIDLMEYYNGKLLANAAWGTKKRWNARWDGAKKPIDSFADPKWDERFHVWRMDWDSRSIKLSVDGLLLNTIDVTRTINPTDRGPKNPFRQPHYLLINLAIGGDSGGDPSKTPFPTRYEIDYVRVYQRK